jgi:RHS repeat-associated protein
LADSNVTGDFVIDISSGGSPVAHFEPPISNVVHEEGVIPELPASGGTPIPTSGMGESRERIYSSGISVTTTTPVPTISESPDNTGDPRDTPPPIITGEGLGGPPAIPPFISTCPPPVLFEGDETTTTEASFIAGDPVYMHNGEFVRSEQDYFVEGRGPSLRIVRTYRSRVRGQSIVGYGWTINWEKYLIDLGPAGGTGYVYKNGFGRNDRFGGAGESETIGVYSDIRPNAIGGRDIAQGNGAKLAFTPNGLLARIADRIGEGLAFEYNDQGQLVAVSDAIGRQLKLTYNTQGLLEKVEDWAGRQIIYRYYENGEAGGSRHDLKSVTATATTLADYPTGETTVYTYENDSSDPSRVHNLVSVTRPQAVFDLGIDPAQRFTDTDVMKLRARAEVLNVYDDTDRVVEQRYKTGTYFFYYAPTGKETTVTDRAIETGMTTGLKTIFRYSGNVPKQIEQTSSLGQAVFTLERNDAGFAESTAYKMPSGRRLEFTYDRANSDTRRRGDLIAMEWVGPNPGERVKSTQILDGFGQVVKIVEPRGYASGANPDRFTTEIFYDSQGNPIRTVFPAISHYDSQGRVAGASPRLTRDARYNAYGQVTRVVDVGGAVKDYTYYPAGDPREGLLKSIRLTSADGAKVLETFFELDQLGRPVQVTEVNGSVSSALYDVYNRVVETVDPTGARRKYSYDKQGRLVLIKLQNLQPDGQGGYQQAFPKWFTKSRTYDDFGRPQSVILGSSDPGEAPLITRFTHDEADRITSVTSNGGTVTRYEYGPRSLSVRTVVAAGTADEAAHTIKYDIEGQVISLADPEGNTVIHEYDWMGRLAALHDPIPAGAASGASTRLEYDLSSHVTRVYRLDRNGTVIRDIRRTYDERGRVAVEEDALAGARAVRTYDDVGRNTRTAVYGATGAPLLRETRRGFVQNSFGEVAWSEDGVGNRIEYHYDSTMRLASVERIGSNGQLSVRTEYSYDAKNRVYQVNNSSNDGSLQQTSRVAFDSRNLIVGSTDANGETTRNTYNGLGQLVAIDRFVDPIATQHETFGYDKEGRLEKLTDGGGNATVFEYNRRGERTRTTVYDGSVAHVIHKTGYDMRGLPISLIDARGNVVTNRFDELGRLARREIQRAAGVDGPTFERFVYDDMNQLLEAENDFSHFTQKFNDQGLIESETHTQRIGGQSISGTIQRRFNLAGAMVELRYPGGRVVEYGNDQLNRPILVTEGSQTVATFSYLAPGLQFRKTYGNGAHTTFAYDGLARLQTVNHFGPGGSAQPSFAYTYDLFGNVLSETERTGQLQDVFTYDPLHRLDTAEVSKNLRTGAAGRLIDYEYDWAGNLFSVADAGQATLYTANGLNQYIAVGPPGQQEAYTWDEDLNLSESPGRKLYYDYARNLIRAEKGQKVYEFTYDAVRRLIHKRVTEQGQPVRETRYYYDEDRVIETEGDEAATYVYGYGLDEVVSYRRGGADYYIHQKRLWSVSHVTDDSGRVVESYHYDPYGARKVFDENGNEMAASAIGNVIGFTGRWIEQDLGLYNFRARWYDYNLGRFTSPDPDGWGDGLNVYRYARNNPATFFDPMGTSSTEFLSGLKDGFAHRFLGGWWDTLETIADIVFNIGDYVETLKMMLKALTDPDVRAQVWGAIKQAVEKELAEGWNLVERAISALAGKVDYGAGQTLGEALGYLASKLMRGGGSIATFFAKIGKEVKDILLRVRCQINRVIGTEPRCFLAGTLVITKDGPKKIQDVRVGDEVLSRDERTGEQGYKKVVRVFRGHTSEVVCLRVAVVPPNKAKERHFSQDVGGRGGAKEIPAELLSAADEQIIRSTVAHPYWVEGRGWVHAEDLQAGDRLIEPESAEFTVMGIEIRDEEAYHYNFEVEDWHTYFVTESEQNPAVWVHNAGCDKRASKAKQGDVDPDSPPAPISTYRGVFTPTTREAIPVAEGDHRRHMISDRSMRTVVETALSGNLVRTREDQRAILIRVGFPPKSLSDEDINNAARSWHQRMTNNQENLWPGSGAENIRMGTKRDFPPGTTPGHRK